MPFRKKLFNNFFGVKLQRDEFSELISNYKPKYDDDVMECLQFCICFSRTLYLEKSLTFISN